VAATLCGATWAPYTGPIHGLALELAEAIAAGGRARRRTGAIPLVLQ
jgi:hypothetical protein